jgi:glucose-1-phosphate thymidylyltransferase
VALYDLADKKLASRYGVVSIDKNGRVVKFQEKPPRPESTLISTCIYYFPSEKLKLFDMYLSQGSTKDASGNYIKWLMENDSVTGYVLGGRWYDIGDMESYKKADEDFKKGGF